MTHLRRWLRSRLPGDPERGSVTIWMITTAMTMIVLVGLAVDLGGQVLAKQRAQVIAFEAARAGGQQLAGGAVLGQPLTIDPGAAVVAADAYLAGAPDVAGTASVAGTVVVVDTTTTYPTKFLGIIGISSLTVTGHAEVQTVRVVQGVTR